MRESFSLKWFEWEPSIGVALPGVYGGTDFNNRGERGIERNIRLGRRRTVETTDQFLYLQAGLWAQFGALGLSATGDLLRYDVAAPQEQTPSLALSLVRMHYVAAYSFFNNQLCVGAGVRSVYVSIDEVSADRGGVFGMLGFAPQAGVIVKPDAMQWRFGATARAAVEAGPFSAGDVFDRPTPDGDVVRSAGSFVLPNQIRQPWELEAGVAYQIGPRPLNPSWIDPHVHERNLRDVIERRRRERAAAVERELAAMPTATEFDRAEKELRTFRARAEEKELRMVEDLELREAGERLYEARKARYVNWPRERLLLLASALVTGPSADAVALEGFINRERELVGRRASVSPRFAVETEAVPDLLKFRAGVYFEPSRFSDGSVRQHFTFGGDLKMLPWDVFGLIREQTWRLSAFLDVAPRYQNFGVGIGAWH